MKIKFSWVTKNEQYHERQAIGLESTIVFFFKLFFDEEVKWLHLEKQQNEV